MRLKFVRQTAAGSILPVALGDPKRSPLVVASAPLPFSAKNRLQTLFGLRLGSYPRLIQPYGALAAPAAMNLFHLGLHPGRRAA